MDISQTKLGIVVPVWLQEPSILEMTLKAVGTIKTRAQPRLYIVLSRLREELIKPKELKTAIEDRSQLITQIMGEPGVDRSVAACWNAGVRQAITDGATSILIFANDVRLYAETIDCLLAFGEEHPEIALWSGLNVRNPSAKPKKGHGVNSDFSCFMIRDQTFERHGTFDEKFRPAYFEDNDYYGRVILGGELCANVHDALMDHIGSQTIHLDPEAAYHASYWFNINRQRFYNKWQTSEIGHTPEDVLKLYAKHPWGDKNLPLSFWDRD